MLARMQKKRNTPSLLVGLQASTTTLESNLVVSQNATCRQSYTNEVEILAFFGDLAVLSDVFLENFL